MTDQSDNFADVAETDKVETLEADTPDPYDYYDPDEDQDNVEAEAVEGTDDEDEAETDTEEQSEVEEDAEEKEADEQAEKKALVTLADGKQVTHDELVNGYQRQADYTRKAQEVANQRSQVAEQAGRIERITQTFVEHLSSMVPPEPATALAYSDPARYQAQKAQYDASIAQVQRLIEMSNEPKEVTGQITQEQHQKMVMEETRKLQDALPETATREGQKAFWESVVQTGEELGFSRQELAKVTDHRMLLLAHWAKKGMAAEKSVSKAKAKAQKAPPATPRKPGQPAKQANRNVDAMRKLSRSGSMKDALNIDFE